MKRLYGAIFAAAMLASCGGEPKQETKQAPAAPIPVRTAEATLVQVATPYEASGTVRARTSATISAKLMGYAREVNAQIGDRVREGQTLVALDARDLDTAIRRAEAARDEVRSAMPEADGAIAAAKSQVDLAQVTFNRMQELLGKRSVTNQEFDEASARLKAAQASEAMARARRTQLDAKLAQVEQEVSAAGIQRGYSTVTAPFSGVVLTKSIEPGTLVVPGAPLFTIERDDTYRFEASVEESRLPRIRVGQTVTVTIEGAGPVRARVSELVPSVDAASRTGIVKIDLPAIADLRSGVFGRAAFDAGARDALAVPAEAVVERGQLQSVFVADAGVARMRLVTLGAKVGDRVEVLSGLAEKEQVIAPIPPDVRDGARVEVRP